MSAPDTRPFPNLDPPAWTLLLRAASGQAITIDYAAGIVGPDLAAEAVAQLVARHMLDENSRFMPVAEAVRRWNRPKVQP
jgi:hypothetical protein